MNVVGIKMESLVSTLTQEEEVQLGSCEGRVIMYRGLRPETVVRRTLVDPGGPQLTPRHHDLGEGGWTL